MEKLYIIFFIGILSLQNLYAQQTVDYKKYTDYMTKAELCFSDSVALSILSAKEAYKLVEKNGSKDSTIKVLKFLSKAYQSSGQFNEAISYSLELLRLGEKVNDNLIIAKAYLRIGDCYRSLSRLNDALHFHNLAIEKYNDINNKEYLAQAYTNVGATYFENGLYDEALECFQKSHDIFVVCNDTIRLGIVYNSFGIVYSQIGNYIEAKNNFLKALNVFTKYNIGFNCASVSNNLGKLYIELGELLTAEEYLNKSKEYLIEKPNIELELVNLMAFISLHEKKYDYKKAFNCQRQLMTLNDSIRNKEIIQKVEQYRIIYDVEKMEKDLELSYQQNLIKEKNIRIIIILFLGGSIIAILVVVLLMIKNRQAQTRLLVSEKEKEISLLKVANIEEEKKRVNEKYKVELDYKSRELISTTMHIVQKNRLKKVIRNDLESMKLVSKDNECIVQGIIKEIDQSALIDKDWEEFVKHFKDVHPDFFDQLIKKHPDLTSKEIRYCAYSRLNLSLKEIAAVLNITSRGVEKARSRIRAKFDLPKDIDLNIYLQTFDKE